jgi:dTDP-4-dehydrorhamnose 3,5-epimerase
MQFTQTTLPGTVLVEPKVFEDERGFFFESYHRRLFEEQAISLDFVQDNHSRSRQGALRGMHYQIHQPQGKLVRVILGEIYDVVDLRKSSPHLDNGWAYLSANKKKLYVAGFMHELHVTNGESV